MLKSLLLTIVGTLLILFVLSSGKAAALNCAAPTTNQEAAQCGACFGSGVDPSSCGSAANNSTTSINNTIHTIINLISIVAGIIAVVMLIVGGIRYVTSSGNDQAVAVAKKTITYALIGLVIVALAQVVVKFTLHTATKNSGTSTSGSSGGRRP